MKDYSHIKRKLKQLCSTQSVSDVFAELIRQNYKGLTEEENSLLTLKNRWKTNEKRHHASTIGNENYLIERSKVLEAFFAWIDEAPSEVLDKVDTNRLETIPRNTTEKKKQDTTKWILLGLGAVVGIVILFILARPPRGNEQVKPKPEQQKAVTALDSKKIAPSTDSKNDSSEKVQTPPSSKKPSKNMEGFAVVCINKNQCTKTIGKKVLTQLKSSGKEVAERIFNSVEELRRTHGSAYKKAIVISVDKKGFKYLSKDPLLRESGLAETEDTYELKVGSQVIGNPKLISILSETITVNSTDKNICQKFSSQVGSLAIDLFQK